MKNELLTPEETEIATIQSAMSLYGWQWIEHVFNDGHTEDCYLEISCKKDPVVFSKNAVNTAGWGRFSRLKCWRDALEWAKQHKQD